MPAVSKKQQKFMQAVAKSPKFAKKVGVKQSIGREFTKEKDMKKAVKKMNMGGRAMADRAGAQAMDPRMAMAMEAQQKRAAMGGMKKGGKVKKMRMGGNTSRTNEIEQLGRLDSYGKGGKNLKDEKARVVREIKNKKAGGKVGYKAGGKVKKMNMGGMADKEGRAMAAGRLASSPAMMADARGRAMAMGGVVKKVAKAVKSKLAKTGGSSAPMKAKGKKMMGGGKVKAYKKGGKVSSASKRADGIAQRGHTKGRMV
mgnify:FL=1